MSLDIKPFPDRIRLPFSFDPDALALDLQTAQTGTWIDHFNSNDYNGEWQIAALRRPVTARGKHPIMSIVSDPSCEKWEDCELVEHCPTFRAVMSSFKAPLTAVRLMSLAPGSIIKKHTDYGLSYEEGTVRIHVPIRTSDEVDFFVNGEKVVMRAGECWYLRLSDPHWVENRSGDARVHLVLDIRSDPSLGRMLQDGLTAC